VCGVPINDVRVFHRIAAVCGISNNCESLQHVRDLHVSKWRSGVTQKATPLVVDHSAGRAYRSRMTCEVRLVENVGTAGAPPRIVRSRVATSSVVARGGTDSASTAIPRGLVAHEFSHAENIEGEALEPIPAAVFLLRGGLGRRRGCFGGGLGRRGAPCSGSVGEQGTGEEKAGQPECGDGSWVWHAVEFEPAREPFQRPPSPSAQSVDALHVAPILLVSPAAVKNLRARGDVRLVDCDAAVSASVATEVLAAEVLPVFGGRLVGRGEVARRLGGRYRRSAASGEDCENDGLGHGDSIPRPAGQSRATQGLPSIAVREAA
jgi:hypothetical protein